MDKRAGVKFSPNPFFVTDDKKVYYYFDKVGVKVGDTVVVDNVHGFQVGTVVITGVATMRTPTACIVSKVDSPYLKEQREQEKRESVAREAAHVLREALQSVSEEQLYKILLERQDVLNAYVSGSNANIDVAATFSKKDPEDD